MGAPNKSVDKSALRMLVPISALSDESFQQLSRQTVIEEIAAGQEIFVEGDTDARAVYLLSGKVVLKSANKVVESINGDAESARYPLAHHSPRQLTAQAKSKVSIARIDTQLLDVLLTSSNVNSYEVSELAEEEEDDNDWMTLILKSKAFANLPPSNIQSLFIHLEPYQVQKDGVIIKQGEIGDYYYIIRHGRCKVTRTSKSKEEVTLAELSNGDTFGEEALISDARRNATITMLTDGELMRLSKDDFNELMKKPLLNWIDMAGAEKLVAEDKAVWLDVRLPNEHEKFAIPDSQNIPLSMVRRKVEELQDGVSYILYCDSGRRSSVAAFLLNQRGFEAYVLSGGYANDSAAAEQVPASQAAQKDAEVIDFKTQKVPAATKDAKKAKLEDQENTRRQAKEEARKRSEAEAEAEVNRLRAEQEQARKHAEEETAKARAEATAAKKMLAEAQAAKKQAEAEAARLKSEREAVANKAKVVVARLKQEQADAKSKADGELQRLQQEAESARIKAEEEASRLKSEAEAARKKAADDAVRIKNEQQTARKQAEAEAARAREEASQAKQQAEDEAARLKKEAEDARQRVENEVRKHSEETARLQAEAEAARKSAQSSAADVKAAQESIRLEMEEQVASLKREAEEANARAANVSTRQAEADATRLEAEQEFARLKADAETARLKAEEAATRARAEAEEIRIKAEQEAEHMKAEAESDRIKAEEEAARLRADAEAARMDKQASEENKIEEAARLETAACAAQMEADEAQRIIEEAEVARRAAEKESAALMKSVEEARSKAEEEVEQLRTEAEEIRQKAVADAERIKQEANEERKKIEQQAQRLKVEEEAAKQKASEESERLESAAIEAQAKAREEIVRLENRVLDAEEVASTEAQQGDMAPAEIEPLDLGAIPDLGEDQATEKLAAIPEILDSGSEDMADLPEIPDITDDVDEVATRIDEEAQQAEQPVEESGSDEPDDLGGLVDAVRQGPSSEAHVDLFGAQGMPARDNRKIAMLGGGIAAVLVIAIGAWFAMGPSDDSTEATQVASSDSPAPQSRYVPAETAPPEVNKYQMTRKSPQAVARVEPKPAPKASVKPGRQPVTKAPRVFSDSLRNGGKAPAMVVIPGGSFKMGSSAVSTQFDEKPLHKVTLKQFAMSKFEVSIAEYRRFLQATNYRSEESLKGTSNQPAANISWKDATAYVKWLSQQTGKSYRLPSEAEWEYAYRAGDDTLYPWGADVGKNNANCFGCGSQWDFSSTAPVGSFAANKFGLYNMAGNIMEWTNDCYHKNYQGAPTDGSVWGDDKQCNVRVVRGGAFNTPTSNLRLAKRSRLKVNQRADNTGLRLVREY
ncbi:MAG: hypothetical protein BMS9Abin26_0855 [Gammaproteobacteria bacterium]|nr:MAG: hypothetical protein BMS9Abin26_0855 [Gammaproteobacteria bacterium]